MIGKTFKDRGETWRVTRVNPHHPSLWDAQVVKADGSLDTIIFLVVTSERIEAQKTDDYFVWDARGTNSTGPYTKENAEGFAQKVNAYLTEQEFPAFRGMKIATVGPFYVKTEKEYDRLLASGQIKGDRRKF